MGPHIQRISNTIAKPLFGGILLKVSQEILSPVARQGPTKVRLSSEEDKRATTNVQNGLVFFFLFSLKRGLNLRKVLGETLGKSVEKCEKVRESAETILPFSCCPLDFSDLCFSILHFRHRKKGSLRKGSFHWKNGAKNL